MRFFCSASFTPFFWNSNYSYDRHFYIFCSSPWNSVHSSHFSLCCLDGITLFDPFSHSPALPGVLSILLLSLERELFISDVLFFSLEFLFGSYFVVSISLIRFHNFSFTEHTPFTWLSTVKIRICSFPHLGHLPFPSPVADSPPGSSCFIHCPVPPDPCPPHPRLCNYMHEGCSAIAERRVLATLSP